MSNANPWVTFDAATLMYRAGLIDAEDYDAAVTEAFGERDAVLILGAVFGVLGE